MSAIKTIEKTVRLSRKVGGSIRIEVQERQQHGPAYKYYQVTGSQTGQLPNLGSNEHHEMLSTLAQEMTKLVPESHPVFCLNSDRSSPCGVHLESLGPHLRKYGCVVTLPGESGQVIAHWPNKEGPDFMKLGRILTPDLLKDLS